MKSDPECVSFDISQLQLFRKKDVARYYIRSLDIARAGEAIPLSTLEGKVEITAGEDIYIMIGPCSDVYPIAKQKFERQYRRVPGSGHCPLATAARYGWDIAKVQPCRLSNPSYIYAKAVDRVFCVYLEELGVILTGGPGDYYAVPADDVQKPYIIQADVMQLTYEPMV